MGRFSPEKNHEFIIDIFKELYSKNDKYRLVLVGTGDTEDKIKEKVESLNLQEKVNFLGVRKDVKNLLQSFDLFILPSIFEGLPVTLVEAQGAGLKCFISDTVTKEIDLECELTEFISLDKASKEWADIIDKNREYIRKDTIESLKAHGYDMTENAKNLENRYIDIIATDTHKYGKRDYNIKEKLDKLKSVVGDEYFQLLTEINPRKIINNEDILKLKGERDGVKKISRNNSIFSSLWSKLWSRNSRTK